MRCLIGHAFGSPDFFEIGDQPRPEPGKGQIRIRIEATALGFVDGLIIQGRYQIRPPLPYIPGGEIAGIVDAVGTNVLSVSIGDRVVTWQLGGGMAQYVVVDATDVDRIDDRLPSAVAAAMLVDYQTARYGLFDRGHLEAGETLLVLGASGAVASAAVQLAVLAGAYVIAAASSSGKCDAALELGAHAAIDYSQANWRDQLKKVAPAGRIDVVFDPVGGDKLQPAFRSLAQGGRYLVVGFAGGDIPSLPANLALVKSAMLVGVNIRHFLATQPDNGRRARLALFRMVAAGGLKQPNMMLLPLERATEAIKATMARDKPGKVVLLPQFQQDQ